MTPKGVVKEATHVIGILILDVQLADFTGVIKNVMPRLSTERKERPVGKKMCFCKTNF